MDTTNFFSNDLTPDERRLYDRQFRLEGWDQKIIKNSRVLIAGVGGLGCEIAKNLAMVGVGHLDLVDIDVIEHSNMNRQILFAGAKIGTPKAIVAAIKLKEINPNIEILGHHTSLERLTPKIYKNADVIVGGLDSMNARLNLNAQCIRFKKPFCDGGVGGYNGHVYTVFPGDNACYECYPPPRGESDEMAACTVVGVPRKRVHCVFKGNMAFSEKFQRDADPSNIQDVTFIQNYANELVKAHNFYPEYTKDEVVKVIDRHEPGIITINSIISAIQSHEVIKILHYLKGNLNLGEPNKSYLILNGMTMMFYHLDKKKNDLCPKCGSNSKLIKIKVKADTKCSEIFALLESKGYVLDKEMMPTLTVLDFNNIIELDIKKTIVENKIRNYELVTCSGFLQGNLLVTIEIES